MMAGEGFKALADPTRRRILELLRAGDMTAGELAEHFDISKPSLSHHLATLRNAGLVTDERTWAEHRVQPQYHSYAGLGRMVHGLRGRSGRQAMKGLTMQKQEKPETTKASTGIPARVWVVLMLLCVLNVVAHLAAMPGLPERIPMHWGVDGGVNGWGPRWMASVLGALPLTFLALFYVVPRIDPKGAAYAKFGGFYQGFVISFTVFMCAISWLGELTVWNLLPGKGAVNVIVSGAIGAFFIGMGNYLPRVRQNYTLGIKTPWALDDPDNWRRTHRFGGACFMVVGVSLIVLGFLGGILPETWILAVIMVLAIGSVAAMYVYSYLIWRKSHNS